MKANNNCVLTINGGSSSIKLALFETGKELKKALFGTIENIGTTNTKFHFTNLLNDQKDSIEMEADNQDETVRFLIDWLHNQIDFSLVSAIGHRLVHGMHHTKPEQITSALLDELKTFSVYDPEHLPGEILLIEAFEKRYPSMPQIACFDTAFHTTMPTVAKQLPIPRRYYDMGIQRYGFHGLSYTYIMDELTRIAGKEKAMGKIIIAHLGSGASIAAVKDGKCMDTSMGFTPASGLPMGTRTGDLDPGVVLYFMETEKMNPDAIKHLINHESGMTGISETSADMRELLEKEAADSRAAAAIEFFCYQTMKWIGSFTTVLSGIETLIFSGGIGEHAPQIRSRVCQGLQFLGLEIDESKNAMNNAIISKEDSKVTVRVIATNEELMIAEMVCQVLNYPH